MTQTRSLSTNSPRTTDAVTVDYYRTDLGDDAALYRIINTTDASVDVTLDQTDGLDDTYAHTESADIGTDGTLTVAAGTTESVYVTEPWARLRFTLTPSTAPTSGDLEVRALHR